MLPAVALFVSLLAPSFAGAIRPFETGVTTPDAEQSEQLGYDRIKGAGASFTRVIISWAAVAPDVQPETWDPTDPEDPNYDWTEYDAAIQRASNAGLNVLASIFRAPSWAERCRADEPGICNPDPDMFADFTEAAARRYSGQIADLPKVRFWKAWNEPNLFLFFLPQFKNGKKVSPDLYRTMLNKFAARVKAVDPNNQVVGGGLAPLQRPGGLGPLDFTRRVLCLKGRKKPVPQGGCSGKARFDAWANNPYTTGGPKHESAGPDDVSLGDLPEVTKIMKAARKYGKVTSNRTPSVWVTEFSWDSKGPDPGAVPMKTLKRWVPEALFGAWKAGVTRFSWLSLRDWARPKGLPYSETVESGLYFRGRNIAADKPKPILRAFRFPFVAHRRKSGLKIWGRTPASVSAKVVIKYRKKGGWRKVATLRAAGNGVFSKFVRTSLGKKNRGSVRAEVRGGKAKTLGQAKSLPFQLKPIKDYYQPPFG